MAESKQMDFGVGSGKGFTLVDLLDRCSSSIRVELGHHLLHPLVETDEEDTSAQGVGLCCAYSEGRMVRCIDDLGRRTRSVEVLLGLNVVQTSLLSCMVPASLMNTARFSSGHTAVVGQADVRLHRDPL